MLAFGEVRRSESLGQFGSCKDGPVDAATMLLHPGGAVLCWVGGWIGIGS